jgi:hypothetical protein
VTVHLVIESAIRASVLVMGAWGLLRLLRVRSPAQERMVWLGVLIGAAVTPFAATMARRLMPEAVAIVVLPSASLAGHWLARPGNLLWPLYLGVVALLLARLGVGLLMLARLWRTATPLPALSDDGVRVRSSRRVQTPVTIGPGILLPADWTCWNRDVRARVLTHEKSHVMRGDFGWQLLARAYVAVFWASPLNWWLLRRLMLLADQLSDDAAVAAHGSPADYAALLLEFSVRPRAAFLTVGMARRSPVSLRVERILRATGLSASPRRRSNACLTGLIVLAALSTASPWFTVADPPTTSATEALAATSELPPLRERLRSLEPLEMAAEDG